MLHLAATIFLACFFAVAGGYFLNGLINWYDRWDHQRWLKRRDSMTIEQRIAAMHIDHSSD